jgi:DNA-binding PadR family transcriptional regulator
VSVQHSVLSLVVERPDYGYSLLERLGDEWPSGAVYRAIQRLQEEGAIEHTETVATSGRPRKIYGATPYGIALEAARLAAARHEMLRRLETASAPDIASVIDEYEGNVLAAIRLEAPVSALGPPGLVAKERMLDNEARLKWITLAREAINDGSAFAMRGTA